MNSQIFPYRQFSALLLGAICALENLSAQQEDDCEGLPLPIFMASKNHLGGPGNSVSSGPALNHCGTVVSFRSVSSNLTADDNNGKSDFFVRKAGITSILSLSSLGAQTADHAPGPSNDFDSGSPSISADGRYIVFDSPATGLIPNDTNNKQDVFLRDLETGETKLVSVAIGENLSTTEDAGSYDSSISADGRFVVFTSVASDLVAGDNNGLGDVFVRDLENEITMRVSLPNLADRDELGLESDRDCHSGTISGDGNLIAFSSRATNLAPGDDPSLNAVDIYLHNRAANTTTRLTQTIHHNRRPQINAAGNYLAFWSSESTLTPEDAHPAGEIYRYNLSTNAIELVSVGLDSAVANGEIDLIGGPSISADGRYIVFESNASNLVENDSNGRSDIFVRDMEEARTARVNVSSSGSQANFESHISCISGDGRYVAFHSGADNLVPGDTNFLNDVFVAPNPFFEPVRTSRFLWNSEALDTNWHNIANWLDKDTRGQASKVPGDPDNSGFDDVVFIESGLVEVNDGEVELGSLSSMGQLQTNRPFFVDQSSSSEGELRITDHFTINDAFNISGGSLVVEDTEFRLTSPASNLIITNGQKLELQDGNIVTNSAPAKVTLQGTLHATLGCSEVEPLGFFENGSTLTTDDGATLKISGSSLVSGAVSIDGEGKMEIAAPLMTLNAGAVLREQSEVNSGSLVLTDGVVMNGDGNLSLEGNTFFEEGTINVQTMVAEDALFTTRAKAGFPDASRILNASLSNEGSVFLDASLALGEEGQITNKSEFVMIDNSRLEIAPGVDPNSFWNLEDSELVKLGVGESFIDIPLSNTGTIKVMSGILNLDGRLSNEGDFIIDGSELRIRGGGHLSTEERHSTFQISNGGLVHLTGTGDKKLHLGRPSVIRGAATIFEAKAGDGLVRIDGDLDLHSPQHLYLCCDTQWTSGTILFHADSGASAGNGWKPTILTFSGADTLKMEGFSERNGLTIQKEAKVYQHTDLQQEGVSIGLLGSYHLESGNILTSSPGSSKFSIDHRGILQISEGTSTRIESQLGIRNGEHHAIRIENGATLEFTQSSNPDFSPLLNGKLQNGHWHLGENSRVESSDEESITGISSGSLHLSKNATFNNLPNVVGDFNLESDAELELDDSQFSVSGNFDNSGTLTGDGYSVFVGGQYTVKGSAVESTPSGFMAGAGVITADGGVIIEGTLSPGKSPGVITINGDFTQTESGVTILELAGSVPGDDYDQLVVNGNANLGGTLRLRNPAGGFPAIGSSFMAINATNLTGEFSKVFVDTPSSRLTYDLTTGNTSLMATAIKLDVETFAEWSAEIFTGPELADLNVSGPAADPDNDGLHNLLEYAMDTNPKSANLNPVNLHIEYSEPGVPVAAELTFPWANGMTDVAYTLQYSAELLTWTELPGTVVATVPGTCHDVLTTRSDLTTITAESVYMRLLVHETAASGP